MGRPPPQILGGSSPQCPLGLRPWSPSTSSSFQWQRRLRCCHQRLRHHKNRQMSESNFSSWLRRCRWTKRLRFDSSTEPWRHRTCSASVDEWWRMWRHSKRPAPSSTEHSSGRRFDTWTNKTNEMYCYERGRGVSKGTLRFSALHRRDSVLWRWCSVTATFWPRAVWKRVWRFVGFKIFTVDCCFVLSPY